MDLALEAMAFGVSGALIPLRPAGLGAAQATLNLVPFAVLAGLILATLAVIGAKRPMAQTSAASSDETVAYESRGRMSEPHSSAGA